MSACNYRTTNKQVRSEFNDELNNHSDDEGEPEDEDDEEEDDDDTDNNSDGDEEEDDTREECNKDNEDADVKKENGIIGPTDSPEKAQSPVRRRSRDLRPPTSDCVSLFTVSSSNVSSFIGRDRVLPQLSHCGEAPPAGGPEVNTPAAGKNVL